jgi:hypothetical protein
MKRCLLNSGGSLIVLVFFSLTLLGQKTNKTIDAKDFFDPKSPTSGLQDAIDHLKPDGGTVFLSPGTYKIRKSIVLFSGVYITGSGEYSVIERADSCIEKHLLSPGKEGDSEIQVDDNSGFVKGGEVTIYSTKFEGFNSATAIITDVKGQTLKLDRQLRHN